MWMTTQVILTTVLYVHVVWFQIPVNTDKMCMIGKGTSNTNVKFPESSRILSAMQVFKCLNVTILAYNLIVWLMTIEKPLKLFSATPCICCDPLDLYSGWCASR